MKVLVMSDTHGNIRDVLHAVDLAGPVDMIAHLGDGEGDVELLTQSTDVPVTAVSGNCDIHSAEVRERVETWDGMNVFMSHGDRYMVKQGLTRLAERAVTYGADIALYGHTHIVSDVYVSGIRLLNPGTLYKNAPVKTVAVLEINHGKIRWKPIILAYCS